MTAVPHSPQAEESVIGQLLAKPDLVGEVVGALLEPKHFYLPAHQTLYTHIYEAYYADESIDALSAAEACVKELVKHWGCHEDKAIDRVLTMAQTPRAGTATDHAKIVKADSDRRELLKLSQQIAEHVLDEDQTPETIASIASTFAMRIATNQLLTQDLPTMDELAAEFEREMMMRIVAREKGVELGAYFDLEFLDHYTRGFQPGELWVMGGEPGVGKTAVAWTAAFNFAARQRAKAQQGQQPVGVFMASLEMGKHQSNIRLAQQLTGIDSALMREGTMTRSQLKNTMATWRQNSKDLPLIFNFASGVRVSQLRALIVEAIRRHNVGLVVIDHFRYFDLDKRHPGWTRNDEDDEKVRFLKEDLAKDLNVAVLCLAHTRKPSDMKPDKRPQMSDLRGSGMIAAHADFVSLMYRPYEYAAQKDIDAAKVLRTDAEMLWRKNRHGLTGIAEFYFDPSRMKLAD